MEKQRNWIKQTSCSIWLTNKNLICSICKRQYKLIYEVKNDNLYCIDCFTKNLARIFKDKEFLIIRGLEDVEFDNKTNNIPKSLNKSLRYFILKRDNFKCKACGNTPDKSPLNIDHIIPKSKGGLNNLDNLQTLCFDCNIGKGAKW